MHANGQRYEYPSLNIEQLAERLGVHAATIFRMIRRGEAPPSYRIAKRRLWREIDVLAWLETRRDDGRRAAT